MLYDRQASKPPLEGGGVGNEWRHTRLLLWGREQIIRRLDCKIELDPSPIASYGVAVRISTV